MTAICTRKEEKNITAAELFRRFQFHKSHLTAHQVTKVQQQHERLLKRASTDAINAAAAAAAASGTTTTTTATRTTVNVQQHQREIDALRADNARLQAHIAYLDGKLESRQRKLTDSRAALGKIYLRAFEMRSNPEFAEAAVKDVLPAFQMPQTKRQRTAATSTTETELPDALPSPLPSSENDGWLLYNNNSSSSGSSIASADEEEALSLGGSDNTPIAPFEMSAFEDEATLIFASPTRNV